MTLSGWNPPPQGPGYGGPQPPQQPYGQPQQPYGQQPYGQPGQPYGQPTPPPFGQPTPPPFGQPGFPPPPRKNKAGLVLALVGGAVVVLIIAVVAIVAASGGGSKQYTITAPPTAGGYQQVNDSSGDVYGSTFRNLLGDKGNVVSATYDVNGTKVTFTGVSGTDMGSANGFREGLQSTSAGANVTIHDTDPGGDGTAGCAEITVATVTVPLCYWQTDTSLGMVTATPDISTTGNISAMEWTRLADVMRQMRPDVEKPA